MQSVGTQENPMIKQMEQYRADLARPMLYLCKSIDPKETMKTRSIIAVEISMALTGAAMIGLMLVVSFL